MTLAQLRQVHRALDAMLRSEGAMIDHIFSSTSSLMLREALAYYGARTEETPFVGDRADDLKVAFHAAADGFSCETGLGAKAVASKLPDYVRPVTICDNLRTAALAIVRNEKQGAEAPHFPSYARRN
jgi:histidinol phosphatase-like enzyme